MANNITSPDTEYVERLAPGELYLAVEARQPNLFTCAALGRGLYSEAQLREWADRIGVQLIVVRRHHGNRL